MMQTLTFHQTTEQAVPLFGQALMKGRLYRLRRWLTRKSPRLLDLDERLCCVVLQNSHAGGLRTVCIDCIRGTQGKADAFDIEFHPVGEVTRDRWVGIAREKLSGRELPPVDLVEVGGVYYVRDGHHRVSVARSLGQAYIEAKITVLSLASRVK